MASVLSFQAPRLVSKKTLRQLQGNDDDDIMIDPTALPSQRTRMDDTMDEEESQRAKPVFGAASATELNVSLL
jgi:RNA-binding protein PNO1